MLKFTNVTAYNNQNRTYSDQAPFCKILTFSNNIFHLELKRKEILSKNVVLIYFLNSHKTTVDISKLTVVKIWKVCNNVTDCFKKIFCYFCYIEITIFDNTSTHWHSILPQQCSVILKIFLCAHKVTEINTCHNTYRTKDYCWKKK